MNSVFCIAQMRKKRKERQEKGKKRQMHGIEYDDCKSPKKVVIFCVKKFQICKRFSKNTGVKREKMQFLKVQPNFLSHFRTVEFLLCFQKRIDF